jgi:sugar phosphate isomerase/epimerase
MISYPEGIRSLGSRLKCVHIDDNMGVLDEHLIPFRGNIRWEAVIPVLKEINFPGVLDLELSLADRLPDDLKDEAVRFTASIAKKLQSLI